MMATTAATVSSKVLPSVATWSASGAGRSGATGRSRSSASRRRRSARIAAASSRSGSDAALLGPTPGPLLGRGVDEDLQVGVGQDDGPDVASGHDDPARVGQSALPGEERRADLRDPGHLADAPVDDRAADLVGHVATVDEDAGQATLGVGGQLDLVDERDEDRRVAQTRRRAGGRARSPPGRAGRCRRSGSRGRGRRRRRRCSCRTRPVRRGPRRAGASRRPDRDCRARPPDGFPRPRARSRPTPGIRSRAPPRPGGGRPSGAERPDLGRAERADGAGPELVETDRPDPDPDEPLDRHSRGGEHPPELALPALLEGRPVPGERRWRTARGPPRADGPRRASGAAGDPGPRVPRRAGCPARSAPIWSLDERLRRARSRTPAPRRTADGGPAPTRDRRWSGGGAPPSPGRGGPPGRAGRRRPAPVGRGRGRSARRAGRGWSRSPRSACGRRGGRGPTPRRPGGRRR